MPKQTFFNLPEEKKERIIEAAIEEFSGRSYHKARVTSIADKAGIAKGSFYQYFEDKKDLFKYIIDLFAKKKVEYINQDMIQNRDRYGFFQLLREIYLSGMRFAKENPRLLAIATSLISNKELQEEIWGEYKDLNTEFFQQLLKLGLEKGELDPALDIELTAHFLTGLNYSLIDLVYPDEEVSVEQMEDEFKIIDKMLLFIEKGISKRE